MGVGLVAWRRRRRTRSRKSLSSESEADDPLTEWGVSLPAGRVAVVVAVAGRVAPAGLGLAAAADRFPLLCLLLLLALGGVAERRGRLLLFLLLGRLGGGLAERCRLPFAGALDGGRLLLAPLPRQPLLPLFAAQEAILQLVV